MKRMTTTDVKGQVRSGYDQGSKDGRRAVRQERRVNGIDLPWAEVHDFERKLLLAELFRRKERKKGKDGRTGGSKKGRTEERKEGRKEELKRKKEREGGRE